MSRPTPPPTPTPPAPQPHYCDLVVARVEHEAADDTIPTATQIANLSSLIASCPDAEFSPLAQAWLDLYGI